MPTHRRAFELLRFLLGQQVEVAERVLERDAAELAQRRLGGPEVPLLDRAGEPSVCRALRGHEQMFAHRFSLQRPYSNRECRLPVPGRTPGVSPRTPLNSPAAEMPGEERRRANA